MKILFFSVKSFEKPWLLKANGDKHTIDFISEELNIATVAKAEGYDAVSIFTSDDASSPVLEQLKVLGIKYIALRAAGYNNVDIDAANQLGIQVANVPAYSPYAIAEHAVAHILALNRKIIQTSKRVHQHNFSLDGLVGFDLNNTTIGLIGTGQIGCIMAKIMNGFGCNILAYDIQQNEDLIKDYNVHYVTLETLCSQSDIISLHCPLVPGTKNLIDKTLLKKMKKGVMLINTARGGVVNTEDVLTYLENGHIGYFGMDVYEKENGVFFYDWSGKDLNDPMLKKLLSFSNVLVTPHQGFATTEALKNIASTTLFNIDAWADNILSGNELTQMKAASTMAEFAANV